MCSTCMCLFAEERKLSELECPLLVQLNWGKDDREGRFLLKREVDKTTAVCSRSLLCYKLRLIVKVLWHCLCNLMHR